MQETASNDWGIDFNMVKAYLNLQRDAYQDVIEFVDAEVPEDVLTRIKNNAANDWGDDFNMRLAYIKMQVKAFKSL